MTQTDQPWTGHGPPAPEFGSVSGPDYIDLDAAIVYQKTGYLTWTVKASSGGGGGGGPTVVTNDVMYVTDPNAEFPLGPADPTKPGQAYSADGLNSTYGWNTVTHHWV